MACGTCLFSIKMKAIIRNTAIPFDIFFFAAHDTANLYDTLTPFDFLTEFQGQRILGKWTSLPRTFFLIKNCNLNLVWRRLSSIKTSC